MDALACPEYRNECHLEMFGLDFERSIERSQRKKKKKTKKKAAGPRRVGGIFGEERKKKKSFWCLFVCLFVREI